MVQEFKEQSYLILQNNVVTNVVLWNGDTNTWTPPSNSLLLIQSTTPAIIWLAVVPPTKPITYNLQEVMGVGGIGFTWDGSVLTTNEPDPNPQIAPVITP